MKISNLSKTLLVAIIVAAGGTILNAQTLLNGDFSDVSPATPNPVGAGNYEQTVPPTYFTGDSGFGTSGGVISDTFYSGFSASPTPYNLFLSADGYGETAGASGSPGVKGISQDMGTLKPLTLYSVSVYESTGGGGSFAQGSTTFQLTLDSTVATDGIGAPTTTVLAAPTGNATFTEETVTYETGATVSGDLVFGISAYDAVGQTAGQVFAADAALTATSLTPEPSTWALMGLGLGGLVFFARRRRLSV
jgi:hypothetical protein